VGRTCIIGLDLGQRQDYTAICVTEVLAERTGRAVHNGHPDGDPNWGTCGDFCHPETEDQFYVRSIGRLPLGTRYREVAAHTAQVVALLNAEAVSPYLLVDATGGGIPAYEDVQDGLDRVSCYPTAVTFTQSGAKLKGHLGSARITMPKDYLVQRFQALLQARRFHAPDTPQVRAFTEEARTYEVRVSETAAKVGLVAGAFKTGTHDDLVTAAALSSCLDPHGQDASYIPGIWG
jgi:hypothetical protein